jgi:predicted RNA binding protein YcfA (HicA-like mRNA interferase family)
VKPWTFADACRAARARGWVLVRAHGSHYIFKKPGVPRNLPIPCHQGNLPAGLQRQIMRQLGITPDQL